ncbi:MAG: DUF4093 domain-containing protein, partial [Pseudoflavonifractor sp.]
KERRKRTPGKEGKLGVEGMRPEVLEEALRRAGATLEGQDEKPRPPAAITKADLFADGLSGHPDSAARRQALLQKLDLPQHMSPNALLVVLNALYSHEEYKNLLI